MIIADHGRTYPDAGVIATSPATAPVAAPTVVAFPCCIRSGMSQPKIAAAVATCVFANASDANPSDASALPPLNPNQPNQRIDAPRTTNGTLCGTIGSFGYPLRLPRTNAAASAAAPAFWWTTVPPAKSSAPRPDRPSNPPPHTQCATGA